MAQPELPQEDAIEHSRADSMHASQLALRKRARKLLARVVKSALWMTFTACVIIPTMIASGFLLGPRGVEGLVAAPAVLFACWAAILYWNFGRRAKPAAIMKANVAQLPAQTGDWLDGQRGRLPPLAQDRLDVLTQRLEALTPQLEALDEKGPYAHQLRRLLGEELPELVRGYAKVPVAFRHQPLYGGKSPERQLIEGLDTITLQVDDVHARLAVEDLHAFAAHERYLDLKYKKKKGTDLGF